MDKIKFKELTYPLKNVSFSFGDRLISTVKLNHNLLSEAGDYVSEKARIIDEQIFYFVEEEDLNLSEKEIASKILIEI